MSETISLNHSIMTNNYDLNIWDRLSYETDGEETGGWVINVYEYNSVGDPFGSGRMLEDKTIELTPDEVKRLTLGWGTDLGGDYTEDEDFWLDKDTFFEIYTDIPERVANLLWALPEYGQSLVPNV
jgi:hypothetical protein